ncbi:hypothetical protein V502_03126 [Pseudogymnoascus sp. VKM F-4520 (FW-2644)]|nr:hypothetical protein V502_03126 [Pseudogymnoascus sp. VKM F-4520 (FW-2644)]
MDHFPIISSSQKPWPDFPALTLEDYDSAQQPYIVQPKDNTRYRLTEKDFEDFPFFWLEDQRFHKGLDDTDWRYNFIDPNLEAAIFVQNKYYFGAINELLAFDKPIPTSEFVIERDDGEWVLCTTKLNDYISKWAGHLNTLAEEERSQRLDRAKEFLKHMAKARWHKDRHHLLRVSASVQILARTIESAMIWYFEKYPDSSERISDHINCLQIGGWCESTVRKAGHYFVPTTAYAASAIDSHPGRHQNHTNCSGGVCEASTIDESTYQTKHTPECDGTCGDVEIDSQSLHDVIMQGKIPIISLSMGTDGKLNTEVTHSGDVPHYIAISHVWSDGLGNPHKNALPYCELLKFFRMLEEWPLKLAKPDWMNSFLTPMDRIQKRMVFDEVDPLLQQQAKEMREVIEPMAEEYVNNWLDTLKTSGQYQKVNLWMDTICIPLIPESRKIAITQINDVYSGSFYTIALDAGLESLPDTASGTEIFLRLEVSAWKGRCWTFLERERSTYNLRLKAGNRLVDIAETFNFDELDGVSQTSALALGKIRCFNNWCKLNGVFKEKGFLGLDIRNLFKSPSGIESDKLLDLIHHFYDVGGPTNESMAKWQATSYGQYGESFCLLKCIKHRIADRVFGLTMVFLDKGTSMKNTWNELAARSTARASDRLIIFVSSLDSADNVGVLREIVQLKKEDRMEAWIRKQSIIPVDFLFMRSPHLRTPGLRWAPNDVYPENLSGEVTSRSLDDLQLRITRPGILLTLDIELNLDSYPSGKSNAEIDRKLSERHTMAITDGEIKYSVTRPSDTAQLSKPTFTLAKGDRVGIIFRYALNPNDISAAAIVRVHAESADEIHATYCVPAKVKLEGELSPQDPTVDPTKRSKLDRYLMGKSSTNEEMNCHWNFELVKKKWVVG